jgi:hypothetical protein
LAPAKIGQCTKTTISIATTGIAYGGKMPTGFYPKERAQPGTALAGDQEFYFTT